MTQPPKQKVSKEDIGELNQQELELIYQIRNRFQYGDIIIQTRAGSPYRIMKVTEYQTLD